VTVFEPLAPVDRATAEQRDLARCTEELIESYAQQRFAPTLQLADEMDARFGVSRLTAIYRKMSQRYVLNPPAPGDDSGIVLTEK
jgi:hypothetical protein